MTAAWEVFDPGDLVIVERTQKHLPPVRGILLAIGEETGIVVSTDFGRCELSWPEVYAVERPDDRTFVAGAVSARGES